MRPALQQRECPEVALALSRPSAFCTNIRREPLNALTATRAPRYYRFGTLSSKITAALANHNRDSWPARSCAPLTLRVKGASAKYPRLNARPQERSSRQQLRDDASSESPPLCVPSLRILSPTLLRFAHFH